MNNKQIYTLALVTLENNQNTFDANFFAGVKPSDVKKINLAIREALSMGIELFKTKVALTGSDSISI